MTPVAFYALVDQDDGQRVFHELSNPLPAEIGDGLMEVTSDVEIDTEIRTDAKWFFERRTFIGSIRGQFRQYSARLVPANWVPQEGLDLGRDGHHPVEEYHGSFQYMDGPWTTKYATHVAIPIDQYRTIFGEPS